MGLRVELAAAESHGSLRAKLSLAVRSLWFFGKKNNLFNFIWKTVCIFYEPFKKTKLLKFGSYLKEFNCSALFASATGQLQNTCKILLIGLHLLNDLAKKVGTSVFLVSLSFVAHWQLTACNSKFEVCYRYLELITVWLKPPLQTFHDLYPKGGAPPLV